MSHQLKTHLIVLRQKSKYIKNLFKQNNTNIVSTHII